jgi:N-methylhydantoinase A
VRTRGSIGAAPEPGPLLIDEYDTTVVVRPGWTARRDQATETVILERPA